MNDLSCVHGKNQRLKYYINTQESQIQGLLQDGCHILKRKDYLALHFNDICRQHTDVVGTAVFK